MTVEAGLGSAVSPALPVVNVEVELKVNHFSTKLDESVGMIVHIELGRDMGRKGREEGCRWGWDEEEVEGMNRGLITKFIVNTKE
jgi:hypothetical protein